MKILSLNTHSLVEENYNYKLGEFCHTIAEILPDVFALQEVNQTMTAPIISVDEYYQGTASIKADNHALQVYKYLQECGHQYYWTYLPCHIGYDIYDEGLCLFSKKPFQDVWNITISATTDYRNYLCRKALVSKVKVKGQTYIFASVHMGWWDCTTEKFCNQWNKLTTFIDTIAQENDIVIIMGDFNNPAHIKGEGYDYILENVYYDLYSLAEHKDNGFTATTKIDGWGADKATPIRIDFIISNKKMAVHSHQVIFNGINGALVSDHFGIISELKDVEQ